MNDPLITRRDMHQCSDGYLGNEPTVEGVNMYYIIFNPEDTIESIDS